MLGFLSYSRADDGHLRGAITSFRIALEGRVKLLTGDRDFRIFQDTSDLDAGDEWKSVIGKKLSEAEFLLTIITPGFFESKQCIEELEQFIEYKKNSECIIPIYFAEPCHYNDMISSHQKYIRFIESRQRWDWRDYIDSPLDDPVVLREITRLAQQIAGKCRGQKRVRGDRRDASTGHLIAPAIQWLEDKPYHPLDKFITMRIRPETIEDAWVDLYIDLTFAKPDSEEDFFISKLWKELWTKVSFSVGICQSTLEFSLRGILSPIKHRNFQNSQDVGFCFVQQSGSESNPNWTFFKPHSADDQDPIVGNLRDFLASLNVASIPGRLTARLFAKPSNVVVDEFELVDSRRFLPYRTETIRRRFEKQIRLHASRLSEFAGEYRKMQDESLELINE